MEEWIREFLRKVTAAGVDVHLLTKYVDDVLVVAGSLELGTCWSEGKLVLTEEGKAADEEAGRSRQEVTLSALRDTAKTITP